MRLIADYHIHSNNSKFKRSNSSIEEIARKANSIGLSEVAITDHGYKHFFAAKKDKFLAARNTVDELNLILGTNVLLGMEADVISEDGTLDIDDETLANIDILIIGYHKMIKTDFASYFGKQKSTHEAISAATDAFVNAILRYDVDIVAHPGHGIKLDLYRLGKVCTENDVLVEINNRHFDLSEDEMLDLLRSGCKFVLSSDAYSADSVGKVENAMKIVEKYDIPPDRVVNVIIEDEGKSELETMIDEDLDRLENLLKNKRKVFNVGSLSNEMEAELEKIAIEKGLTQNSQGDDEIDPLDLLSSSDRAVVERAKEILKRKN